MSRRALVIGTVIVVVVSSICVRLGFWQLDRLAQRREMNRLIETTLAQPVRTLEAVSDDVEGYRRVRLRGEYDHEREVVVVNRPYRGTPGVVVLTPLRLASGGAILVQRGWVASGNAFEVDLEPLHEPGETEVTGVIMAPELGARSATRPEWPVRVARVDARMLAARYPYAVGPKIIRQLPDSSLPSTPRRMPLPPPSEGRHLGYAIQWFAFALIFLVGLAAVHRTQRQDVGRSSSS